MLLGVLPTCVIAAPRPELLRSLKRTLEPELEVVAMVDNPVSLQESLTALNPDLAVVDLETLEPSPWKFLSLLRRRHSGVRLLLLGESGEQQGRNEDQPGADYQILQRSRAAAELASAAREAVRR